MQVTHSVTISSASSQRTSEMTALMESMKLQAPHKQRPASAQHIQTTTCNASPPGCEGASGAARTGNSLPLAAPVLQWQESTGVELHLQSKAWKHAERRKKQ